jgi:hypothetical protein
MTSDKRWRGLRRALAINRRHRCLGRAIDTSGPSRDILDGLDRTIGSVEIVYMADSRHCRGRRGHAGAR